MKNLALETLPRASIAICHRPQHLPLAYAFDCKPPSPSAVVCRVFLRLTSFTMSLLRPMPSCVVPSFGLSCRSQAFSVLHCCVKLHFSTLCSLHHRSALFLHRLPPSSALSTTAITCTLLELKNTTALHHALLPSSMPYSIVFCQLITSPSPIFVKWSPISYSLVHFV